MDIDPRSPTHLLTRQATNPIGVLGEERKSLTRQGSSMAVGRSGSVLVGNTTSGTTAKSGHNKSPISISTAGGNLSVVRSGSLSSLLANAPDLMAGQGVASLLEEFPDLS